MSPSLPIIGEHEGYGYACTYVPSRGGWAVEVWVIGKRTDLAEMRPRTYRRNEQAVRAAKRRIEKLADGKAVGGMAAMLGQSPVRPLVALDGADLAAMYPINRRDRK